MLRIAICVNNKRTYDSMKKLYECISDDKINICIFNRKDESINKHTVLSGGEVLVTKRGYIKEYNRILKEYRIRKYKESIDNTQDI